MYHIWTVVCQSSITDEDTHNISLIGALEKVQFKPISLSQGEKVFIPFNFEVVTRWGRGKDDPPMHGRGKLQVIMPSGEICNEVEYDIDLTEKPFWRIRIRNPGLPVQESGFYIFRSQLWDENESAWKNVADVPLEFLLL